MILATFDPKVGRLWELSTLILTLITWTVSRLLDKFKRDWGIRSSVPQILLASILAGLLAFVIQGFLALTGFVWMLAYGLLLVTSYWTAERLLEPF